MRLVLSLGVVLLFLTNCADAPGASFATDARVPSGDARVPSGDARVPSGDARSPVDSQAQGDGSTPSEPCDSVICAANARCIVSGGSPRCQCGPGYEGAADSCVAIIDPCVAAGTCPEGAWVRRALPGIVDGRDSIQSVLVDPVRPSDFYAFSGSNGGPTVKVYVSTDFGDTWEDRNTTAGYTGNPWGVSIDPNPDRDPSTPPTLWSPSGYGANGAWKSVDGGRTWVRSAGADAAFGPYNPHGALLTDLYHIAILPDDPPNHLLATYHYAFKDVGDGGFGESWDGGGTWVIHPPPANIGTSHYVIPISGTIWAVIAQDAEGRNGIWRTTTAGRVGGTAERSFRDGTISTSAWTMVDTLEHAHGSHQNLTLPDGRILVTGTTNGAVSSDQGATWTHFTADSNWAPPRQFQSSQMTNIAATARFAYTNFLANTVIARAPLNNLVGAENWTPEYTPVPEGMTVGGAPFGMASAYNAASQRWFIIAGSYNGSIWKYVEPGE